VKFWTALVVFFPNGEGLIHSYHPDAMTCGKALPAVHQALDLTGEFHAGCKVTPYLSASLRPKARPW